MLYRDSPLTREDFDVILLGGSATDETHRASL